MALRTEKILIKKSHSDYSKYKSACLLTKAIYNCANYYIRQHFFNGHWEINWQSADKYVRMKYPKLYNALPNQSTQSIIKKLGDDWTSFYEANKAFNINPQHFLGKPKPPQYKKKIGTFISSFQSMKVENNKIHFPKKMNLAPINIICCQNQLFKATKNNAIVKEIRIKPQNNAFFLEVVYDKEIIQNNICLDKKNCLSIDLGINNLLTITTNQDDLRPILINGKVIKSINQQYNKSMAYYRHKNNHALMNNIALKRHLAMKDIFHKISLFVKNYCLTHNIGQVIIGKNNFWKQDINIGKVNNQKFTMIPFELLISFMEYKLMEIGVEVVFQEESYTSKSDALAYDILPIFDKANKEKYKFKGKRKQRGLYQSSIGKLINADVNGALNIMRKVIGDGFLGNLINSGCVFQPIRVNLI